LELEEATDYSARHWLMKTIASSGNSSFLWKTGPKEPRVPIVPSPLGSSTETGIACGTAVARDVRWFQAYFQGPFGLAWQTRN